MLNETSEALLFYGVKPNPALALASNLGGDNAPNVDSWESLLMVRIENVRSWLV